MNTAIEKKDRSYPRRPETYEELLKYCDTVGIDLKAHCYCVGSETDEVGKYCIYRDDTGKLMAYVCLEGGVRDLKFYSRSEAEFIGKLLDSLLNECFDGENRPDGKILLPEYPVKAEESGSYTASSSFMRAKPYTTAPDYAIDLNTVDELAARCKPYSAKLASLGFVTDGLMTRGRNDCGICKVGEEYSVWQNDHPVYRGNSEKDAVTWLSFMLENAGLSINARSIGALGAEIKSRLRLKKGKKNLNKVLLLGIGIAVVLFLVLVAVVTKN